MSSRNLTTLSKRVLAKFRGPNGPVTGHICPSEDVEQELEVLKKITDGNTWETPSGARAFEFLDENDITCLAITDSFSDNSIEEISQFSDGTIRLIEPCGAVYLYLCDVLKLKPIGGLTEDIVDMYIMSPANNDDGVALSVIKEHLEEITVFSIANSSSLLKDSSPIYIANYICTFSNGLLSSNKMDDNSTAIIRDIFSKEKDWLFDENLFAAMRTPILKHAFLEVYRTLEFVFVLPRAIALANTLAGQGSNITLDKIEFARICNKELGWKRIERDSLEKIFLEFYSQSRDRFEFVVSHCSPFSGIVLQKALRNENKQSDEPTLSKYSERYYKLRNQTVHQFWPDENHNCTDDDWKCLITFTLECINFIYNKHLSR